MSTIKSSSEHLTLNADGSGNDIKFQSNGVEKASIDQDGLVTCAGSTMSGALTVNSGANLAFKVNGTTYTQLWQTLQSPNDLTLKTTADKYISFQPNSVEKVRIHSSGVTSFNNGIELGSGLDATAANTLEDYEEGTWTPSFVASDGANNPTISYASQSGSYTKIGRIVTVTFATTTNSVSGGSGSTSAHRLRINGLPFTGAGVGHCTVLIFSQNWNGLTEPIRVNVSGGTQLNLSSWKADEVYTSHLRTSGDSNQIQAILTYYA